MEEVVDKIMGGGVEKCKEVGVTIEEIMSEEIGSKGVEDMDDLRLLVVVMVVEVGATRVVVGATMVVEGLGIIRVIIKVGEVITKGIKEEGDTKGEVEGDTKGAVDITKVTVIMVEEEEEGAEEVEVDVGVGVDTECGYL